MKIKTSELFGSALDWAVTWAQHPSGPTGEGWYERDADGKLFDPLNECTVSPSTIWEQGGPIIERESISVLPFDDRWEARCACAIQRTPSRFIERRGPTPLIAAMRCYVASKMGDEIEIPEELAK